LVRTVFVHLSLFQVDDLMAEDDSGSDDESDEGRNVRYRSAVLKISEDSESGSSENSLSGEYPRGWGIQEKVQQSRRASQDDLRRRPQPKGQGTEGETTEDTENEQARFDTIVRTFSPPTSDDTNSSFADSIGSVDDEIADAVEKEFLGAL
jgi:hypothetical protein